MEHLLVDSLGVTYGDLEAVRRFDLAARRGEFVTIIGPSGCGKSSVLHCMGGLQQATTGTVAINGAQVKRPSPTLAAFVFQEYSLYPWLSVADNVSLGLRFDGMGRRERRDAAYRRLGDVGLGGFEQVFPSELSGGMQQRAAIARALVMEPECLLLDEPFGALDEMTRRRLGVELAGGLKEQGQTVVMVTHGLEEAVYWSDRIVVMSQRPGVIVDVVTVPEPWPRSWEFVASDEANDLRHHLLSLLHAENAV
jgi:NitT/TauT family transport system ATP-binding protein